MAYTDSQGVLHYDGDESYWNPFFNYSPQMSDPDPEPVRPAGTNGTPFLGFGIPNTGNPTGPAINWPAFTGAPGTSEAVGPSGGPPPPPPTGGGNIDPQFLDFWNNLYGLAPIPQIDDVTLGENPQINQGFSGDVNKHWQGIQNNNAKQIGEYYNYGDWPTMDASFFDTRFVPNPTQTRASAAQMDLGGIPQRTANTPESFEALDFMLSGQGFDPATMARLNAGATDSISREAASQRGAAKIAAEQAGLTGSGADLAIGGQINRRAGDARTEALNKIAIEDAMRGNENRRIGSGMELQRRTTAADMRNQAEEGNAGRTFAGQQINTGNQQQVNLTNAETANQMALDKAAQEFAAMTQNVNNQQQANQINTGNQQQKEMTRAGKQADFTSTGATNYSNALLTKAADAETQNATNTINRNLNQAQFGRQKQMFNTGIGEGRYSQALTGILGLAGNSNPSAYNFNYQYQPNLVGANAFSNVANSFLNPNRQQNQN